MKVLSTHKLGIFFDEAVIQSFDWQVEYGEKWAILGANGAGKSSLLHALLGLNRLSSAHIFFDERPLKYMLPEEQAKYRVWIPQHYNEPFSITVRHALNSMAYETTDAFIDICLEKFDLLRLQDSWVHLLSGGERQRLTWAMATARHSVNTRLWLLDEPFAAQDLAWQSKLLRHLTELPCSVVVSVHDLNQVQAFATHVLLLVPSKHGSMVLKGNVKEMMCADLLGSVYGVGLRKEISQDGLSHWWKI